MTKKEADNFWFKSTGILSVVIGVALSISAILNSQIILSLISMPLVTIGLVIYMQGTED